MRARTERVPGRLREIRDYDSSDTTTMVDRHKPLSLVDLGLELPKARATEVVSIALPSDLLDRIKASASARDLSFEELVEQLLSESLEGRRAR